MVGEKLMVSLTVKYSFFTPSLVDMVKAVYIVPFAAMFYRRLHQKVSLKSSFWIEGHGLEIKNWPRCNYTCLCLFLNLGPMAIHWASSADPPSLIKKTVFISFWKNVYSQQFLWHFECLFRELCKECLDQVFLYEGAQWMVDTRQYCSGVGSHNS